MELPHDLHTFISLFQNRGDKFFISKQHSKVFILEHPMFILNYITQNVFDRQNSVTASILCLFNYTKLTAIQL
jgi:hypothetical protein